MGSAALALALALALASASALSPAHCKGLKPVIELKPSVSASDGSWDLGLELEMGRGPEHNDFNMTTCQENAIIFQVLAMDLALP